MSHGLLRARFTFGDESEVRYVVAAPKKGDYVTHGSTLWRVTVADTDDLGLYVVCEPSPPADEPDLELA